MPWQRRGRIRQVFFFSSVVAPSWLVCNPVLSRNQTSVASLSLPRLHCSIQLWRPPWSLVLWCVTGQLQTGAGLHPTSKYNSSNLSSSATQNVVVVTAAAAGPSSRYVIWMCLTGRHQEVVVVAAAYHHLTFHPKALLLRPCTAEGNRHPSRASIPLINIVMTTIIYLPKLHQITSNAVNL